MSKNEDDENGIKEEAVAGNLDTLRGIGAWVQFVGASPTNETQTSRIHPQRLDIDCIENVNGIGAGSNLKPTVPMRAWDPAFDICFWHQFHDVSPEDELKGGQTVQNEITDDFMTEVPSLSSSMDTQPAT